MKNSIWVGLSLSLLSAIVTAAEKQNCNWVQTQTSTGVLFVQACIDGSVRIRDEDGKFIQISKETVEALQNAKVTDPRASYGGGVPCVGKVSPGSRND